MDSANSLTFKSNILTRLQVKETVLTLVLSVVIPFMVHLLPSYKGIPMGAILMAMFFAPYIAVRYFKFHVAIIIGLFAPLLNHFLTGNPRTELIPVLTFQLVVFILASKFFLHLKFYNHLNAIFAFLSAMIASFLIIVILPSTLPGASAGNFLTSSLVNSVPGLFLLGTLGYFINHKKMN